MLTYRDKGDPTRRRLAGAAATLLVDLILWVLLILQALGGGLGYSSNTFFAVAMTVGFLAVGVFFGLYARKQNDRGFFQGVVITTSLILLLDVTCWGWVARS